MASELLPPPAPKQRKWLPTIAVGVVILLIVAGGSVTEAALSGDVGPPVGVAGVVKVRPLSGWRVAGRFTVKGIPDLRLTRGNGNLDVLVTEFGGGSDSLVGAYLDQVVAPQARELQVSQSLKRVEVQGGVAFRGFYLGLFGDRAAPIEGEVTGLVVNGQGILFDGWAPTGLFQYVSDDVHSMFERARISA